MNGALSHREPVGRRSRLAVLGGNVLWRVVGVGVGVVGYAAEAGGFELKMRRAASRAQS